MPCCCALTCWSFEDDFNRTNSTSLGTDWNEASGDWGILNNELVEEYADPLVTGNVDAKCIGTNPVPLRSAGEMFVRVSIIDPVVDNEYYIHLSCTSTSGTGGQWVRFTYTAVNTFLVELSTGESKTQSWAPTTAGVFPVIGCIDSDGFLMGSVASSGDEYPWNDGDATSTGRYYGVGHGVSDAGVMFDDFFVEELRAGLVTCNGCFCRCAENNVQKTLYATLTGTDRADCMDGLCVEFNWEWNSGNPRWVSDVLVVGSNSFKWVLECASYDPADPFAGFDLTWYPDALYKTCCSANSLGCDGVYEPDDALSDCDPLELVYGPFTFSTGELSCAACYSPGSGPLTGEWWMTIKEGGCPT